MCLSLLKPLFSRTQINLLRTFEKSSQKINFKLDLILFLSEINNGVFVSNTKSNLLLFLILLIKKSMKEKNITTNSTKKIIYSF